MLLAFTLIHLENLIAAGERAGLAILAQRAMALYINRLNSCFVFSERGFEILRKSYCNQLKGSRIAHRNPLVRIPASGCLRPATNYVTLHAEVGQF